MFVDVVGFILFLLGKVLFSGGFPYSPDGFLSVNDLVKQVAWVVYIGEMVGSPQTQLHRNASTWESPEPRFGIDFPAGCVLLGRMWVACANLEIPECFDRDVYV